MDNASDYGSEDCRFDSDQRYSDSEAFFVVGCASLPLLRCSKQTLSSLVQGPCAANLSLLPWASPVNTRTGLGRTHSTQAPPNRQ